MSTSFETRTAVLADQFPLWLDAVQSVLERNHVRVVGKATSGEQALALVEEHAPDLLVTCIEMRDGGMDGITLLRAARERCPQLHALVLSAYDDREHVDAALAAGAVAYVVKTAHPDDLASAVRQSFESSIYLAVTPLGRPHLKAVEEASSPSLTRRESEILTLVAEGLSNAELARRLWVTEQTVKFHLSNIYRKLDVSNRTEASRWAQLHGLLPAAPVRLSVA
jgi:DNA-binding NarL/FixJ family response regulator